MWEKIGGYSAIFQYTPLSVGRFPARNISNYYYPPQQSGDGATRYNTPQSSGVDLGMKNKTFDRREKFIVMTLVHLMSGARLSQVQRMCVCSRALVEYIPNQYQPTRLFRAQNSPNLILGARSDSRGCLGQTVIPSSEGRLETNMAGKWYYALAYSHCYLRPDINRAQERD